MIKLLAAAGLLAVSTFTFSEDIELYLSETIKAAQTHPQVLIIFDNSGSMSTTEEVKASYDPNQDYDALDGLNYLSEDFVYFTKGSVDGASLPVPDSPSESRRFLDSINSCQTARDILDKYGFYTGHIREYSFKGNSGSWIEVPDNNGANIEIVDCEDDVLALDPQNAGVEDKHGAVGAIPDGYPVDGKGSKGSPIYHTTNVADSNVEWTGSLVTLYSAKYLRWHHNALIAKEVKTRLEIAQESVSNLINSAPYVDFGLQVFNYNDGDAANDPNGGRIVHGIKSSTLANRTTLLDIINDDLDAETWTPLCETLYEASRYFAGKSVDFGDADQSQGGRYTKNTPPRDTSIETSKVYNSPFTSCSDKAYVILITDGEPTYDNGADSKITAIPETGQDAMGSPFNLNGKNNYLAALAGWMNNNDVNTSLDGKQTVSTYTIGFGKDAQDDAEPLLKEAAKLGGGKYFPAQDTASLTAALTTVLENLEPSNDSLTSASVAANNFDRTETLNSVYYAMFQPNRGPRWQGNLKKYKVEGGIQVGKSSVPAIHEASGHFSPDVTSFWSPTLDGDQVAEGGVAEMLRNKTDRTVYSDIGSSGALIAFTKENADTYYGSAEDFATVLDVPVESAASYVSWAKGVDVDDENGNNSRTDMRYDVFGDPLHSKPLVINYGDKIRIVIGTNAGALHMFADAGESVDESWAFMPKEFFNKIKPLRENYSTADKIYAIDGRITSLIRDYNGDGIVNGSDTVWIFFGLRRGGTSYYAMDITNPDSPSLMWHVDADTTGFTELGQSWSQPKVGYSKLNIVNGTAKPVLFFGGGYDISKDAPGVGTSDSVGRSIYMVDAETGALKWSMAPSGGTTTFNGTDSIPSTVATLDSDGDGLVDRLYTGDTGGNVWRVDMPSANATGEEPWTVFKLASVGTEVPDDNANDRRFFNEPSLVRTFISETLETEITDEDGVTKTIRVHQEKPYDAILLGSGDRSNPLGTDTKDRFYMFKDENIKTSSFTGSSTPGIPSAITESELFDYTYDPFDNVSAEGLEDLKVAVSEKSGWYMTFTESGEKSSSSAIVINGVVYFTSFIPPDLSGNVQSCELPNGQGWLYAVDLALGTKKYDWRKTFISEQFLGSPTLIVIPEDSDSGGSSNGEGEEGEGESDGDAKGNLIVGRKIINVGFSLKTMRTYLYVTEEK